MAGAVFEGNKIRQKLIHMEVANIDDIQKVLPKDKMMEF